MLAPLLLIVGAWGLQYHRRGARLVLLMYAGLWIVGSVGVQLIDFIDYLAQSGLSTRQLFGMAAGRFDLAVYGLVYPVFVTVCLARPEIEDHFSEHRRGFSVLPNP
jgi:hypothetical protein